MVLTIASSNVTVTSLTPGYLYTFYLQSFGAGGTSNKSNCSYSTCKWVVFNDEHHPACETFGTEIILVQ